jgi:hypothetical protein
MNKEPLTAEQIANKAIDWAQNYMGTIAYNSAYQKSRKEFVASLAKKEPGTAQEGEIKRLADLKDNWNGYGAKPFSEDALIKIQSLCDLLKTPFKVFPTGRGSIQFEWEKEENYFELEVYENGQISPLWMIGDAEPSPAAAPQVEGEKDKGEEDVIKCSSVFSGRIRFQSAKDEERVMSALARERVDKDDAVVEHLVNKINRQQSQLAEKDKQIQELEASLLDRENAHVQIWNNLKSRIATLEKQIPEAK